MHTHKQDIAVITVDGPGGSGKGTVCGLLAKKLGWNLLDSGSLYRLMALAAINKKVSPEDEKSLAELADSLNVRFETPIEVEGLNIFLDNKRVDQEIRQEKIGLVASQIALLPKVRACLLNRQRIFATEPGLVADGRDMGTVVFPDASVKFFLTASPEERARRRVLQLAKQGVFEDFDKVLSDVINRDKRDTERVTAPLRPAEGAVQIDSTSLSIDQVVIKMVDILLIKSII